MTETKRCTSCGEDLPVTEYYRDKRMRSGRYSECKACVCARRKRGKDANREAQRRYRERHAEELRAYNNRYYREHQAERAEAQRRYRARCKAGAE